MPRISVAVPVYNGAALLGETLADLQAQTCRDIEFVIYDNGSTDKTAEIADRVISADSRFRMHRRPSTIPAMQNFKDSLERSDCELFAWRSYDDLSSPNYFERLAQALDETPRADLAISSLHTFKERRNPQWTYSKTPTIPSDRLLATLKLMNVGSASWFFCLFRRERLLPAFQRAVEVLPLGWATDELTLFPFLLDGVLGTAPDVFFAPRNIVNPGKTQWVPEIDVQWQIRKSFYDACLQLVDESDFSPASKWVLRSVMRRHTALCTFRLTQLYWRTLTGRATAPSPF